jgi:hypothetical protein
MSGGTINGNIGLSPNTANDGTGVAYYRYGGSGPASTGTNNNNTING